MTTITLMNSVIPKGAISIKILFPPIIGKESGKWKDATKRRMSGMIGLVVHSFIIFILIGRAAIIFPAASLFLVRG